MDKEKDDDIVPGFSGRYKFVFILLCLNFLLGDLLGELMDSNVEEGSKSFVYT